MKVIRTNIAEVVFLEPSVFCDRRGHFFESFSRREFERLVGRVDFVQENESSSIYGVLRGMHFQREPHAQAKLVRVVRGKILDVAVDIRVGSPTFGEHALCEISSDNRRQIFIPRGFAHGFAVLSEEATVVYKCDNYYAPESAGTIAWNDPVLNINWGIDEAQAILSENDRSAPPLKEITDLPEYR